MALVLKPVGHGFEHKRKFFVLREDFFMKVELQVTTNFLYSLAD